MVVKYLLAVIAAEVPSGEICPLRSISELEIYILRLDCCVDKIRVVGGKSRWFGHGS